MEDIIWDCITKRLTDSETEASKLRLDNWLMEDLSHVQQYQEAKLLWSLTGEVKSIQPETGFQHLLSNHQGRLSNNRLKVPGFWVYGIAASLVLLILAAVLSKSFHIGVKPSHIQEWVIRKAGPGQIILVNMPDSSKVWLNSGTEIKFLKSFNDEKIRTINLKGEAYFDVHHDPSHPFVVKSEKLTTTVYGTSFNVRAYVNERKTSVTVKFGKVGVSAITDNKEATMLLPQDRVEYAQGRLSKSIVDTQADGWLRGDIVFDQTPLTEVFETISRKFDIKILTGTSQYQHCKLTARFSNQPLSAVLRVLKMSMNIRSTQKGKTIYLEGGTACSSHTK